MSARQRITLDKSAGSSSSEQRLLRAKAGIVGRDVNELWRYEAAKELYDLKHPTVTR